MTYAPGFLLGGTAGHHAQRRGPAARGRPQPHPRRYDPELRQLRPDLRLRGRHHHPRRHAPHVRATRTCTTTSPLMNENYPHPASPARCRSRHPGRAIQVEGQAARHPRRGLHVQLMGSGTILRSDGRGRAAVHRFGASPPTSGAPPAQRTAPRRHGREQLEPAASHRAAAQCWVRDLPPEGNEGPVIASTDYMRNYADPALRRRRRYAVLGTAGFGRSDYRVNAPLLRGRPFYVTVAALKALADEGTLKPAVVAEAIAKYGLTPSAPRRGPSEKGAQQHEHRHSCTRHRRLRDVPVIGSSSR